MTQRIIALALAFVLLPLAPRVASGGGLGCRTAVGAPQLPARRFAFPRDDGAHADFASEWWRTFGRVSDARGTRYDFNVSVSRFAIDACASRSQPSASRWASHDVVSTTYEVLDESTLEVRRGTRVERVGPFGARLAARGLDVVTQLADYRAIGNAHAAARFALGLKDTGVGLALEQRPDKPLPLGLGGIVRTGSCGRCAAYAYAYPASITTGTLRLAGITQRVSGSMWFEHEYAQRELAPTDAGWNRYDLQFDDGRLLDVRFTRDRAGNVATTSGVFVDARGAAHYLHDGDARLQNVLHTVWRSVPSGVTYPSLWYLSVPSARLGLATVEVALDQESRDFQRTPCYAGAIVVERVGPPEADHGHGFVELTGYDRPLSL